MDKFIFKLISIYKDKDGKERLEFLERRIQIKIGIIKKFSLAFDNNWRVNKRIFFRKKIKNIEKRLAATSNMLVKGGIMEFLCENKRLEELNLDFM